MPGSNFDKASASVDVGSISLALLAFNGAVSEDIKAKDDGTTTATPSTGIVTGAFSNSGYLTDGNNLNIGYAGENSGLPRLMVINHIEHFLLIRL